MGIDAHSLHLLRHARTTYGPLGRTITLGRLGNFLGPRATQQWFGAPTMPGQSCESMLQRNFGATSVDSIDNSNYEGATIIADMNKSLIPALTGKFDSVLDFGCMEHIFDVAQCIRNITALCKPGGFILHCLPANGFNGHGFYQFSPELFFSCYSEVNGFTQTEVYIAELSDTTHWYRVSPPSDGHRVNLRSPGEMYVIAGTRRRAVRELSLQQSDYMFTWNKAADPNTVIAPSSGRRYAGIKEAISSIPMLARLAASLDARLSPYGSKKPNQHRKLTKISTKQL